MFRMDVIVIVFRPQVIVQEYIISFEDLHMKHYCNAVKCAYYSSIGRVTVLSFCTVLQIAQ